MFLNNMRYLNLTTEFQLLRFVHALWTDEVDFFLREELKEAKRMNSCEQDFSIMGAKLKHGDNVEENELGKWLEQIRASGYTHCSLYSLYSIVYAYHLCVCVRYHTDKCCYKKVEFIYCKFCSEIDIVIKSLDKE